MKSDDTKVKGEWVVLIRAADANHSTFGKPEEYFLPSTVEVGYLRELIERDDANLLYHGKGEGQYGKYIYDIFPLNDTTKTDKKTKKAKSSNKVEEVVWEVKAPSVAKNIPIKQSTFSELMEQAAEESDAPEPSADSNTVSDSDPDSGSDSGSDSDSDSDSSSDTGSV